MGKLLHHWAGPGILFLLGIGAKLMSIQNWLWSGIFWVLALLWFIYWLRHRNQGTSPIVAKQIQTQTFSINWNTHEWRLQVPTGWQNYWEDEANGISLILDGHLTINTFQRILVESVELDIGGKLFRSDWKSFEYVGFDEPSIQFYVELDTQRGKRTATLQAIVNGKSYTSEPFILDLPQGKRVFGRESSQP